jgi:hypothetical protein
MEAKKAEEVAGGTENHRSADVQSREQEEDGKKSRKRIYRHKRLWALQLPNP